MPAFFPSDLWHWLYGAKRRPLFAGVPVDPGAANDNSGFFIGVLGVS